MKRSLRNPLAFAIMAAITLGGMAALDLSERSPSGTKFPGGHLRYTYHMETGIAGLAETTTTELTPVGDGRYDIVTTTRAVAAAEQIQLGLTGFSMRWLGLYMSEDTANAVDLSPLNALAQQTLLPQKRYVLPDGGLLETGDRVTVAGLPGIEATYTKATSSNVAITVVLADDLQVRQLLPFPLSIELKSSQPLGTTGIGDEALSVEGHFSGRIELLEFVWTDTAGVKP